MSTQSICLSTRASHSLLTISKEPTQPPPSTDVTYTELGCFDATNDAGVRLLRGPAEQRVDDLTQASCQEFCNTAKGAPEGGFKYYGIEFGRDCRCSNELSWSGDDLQDDPSLCNSALTGDPNTYAGGEGRITVWQNDDYKGGVRQLSYMLLNSSMLCILFFLYDPG